ncbi:hypothetical protein NM208_g4309 [Fusarium decemcellulare]|uniref:Uncharacterized protein n=1 Tax=Fusarium decemcellulare TaxID=57161 RepID=A0ACC1SLB8_9HYPO|nr:hypothetical protein NM208_g4309 [Fusarium decemcellulare]
MAPSKARHACRACRRLGKRCEYSDPVVSPSSDISEPTRVIPLLEGPDQLFPPSFFLDRNFLTPLYSSNAFASTPQPYFEHIISKHLPLADHATLYDEYFSSIHVWLPMISRKRLVHIEATETDSCQPLLLLSMKLCCTNPQDSPAAQNHLYDLTKSLCSFAENSGLASLRLVQSIVLLSAYELSHAIYPAAYLTISRAARLGSLMGWHDRRAQQLFQLADTWSLREEQRRTWWAIFILDRFINIDTSGLPFASPEPFPDELLPVNDEDWGLGKAVPNEPLYTASFSSITTLGSFARSCQAAHMLGKVIHHKEAKRKSSQDAAELLQEAQGLHRAMASLQLSLEESVDTNSPLSSERYPPTALLICASAQPLLHGIYGCLDTTYVANQTRMGLETEMQDISIAGLRSLASHTAPAIARVDPQCPLVARCFYAAAQVCGWFVREDNELEMRNALECVVSALERLAERWVVAVEYLALLEQSGTLRLIGREYKLDSISRPGLQSGYVKTCQL